MAGPFYIVTAVDAAYGTSSRADRTAIVTGCRDLSVETPKIHLLDAVLERVELQAVPDLIEGVYRRWEPAFVGIENTLWQAALIQTMRRKGTVPFVEIDRRKARNPDKRTRAGNLAFHYAEKHIWHPSPRPVWLDDCEQELLAFTGEPGRDLHDDFVDAWVDCVDFLTLIRSTQQSEPVYLDFVVST